MPVLFSCTGSQEPIQKTQQCSTAKQRFVNKGVQWLFPLCTGTPGHNQNATITDWTKVRNSDLEPIGRIIMSVVFQSKRKRDLE